MSYKYAIETKELGKCYQIYSKPSDRLRQMLYRGKQKFFREFWALRDVSMKICIGETVGIIGRNGSGKSTLLQIICGTLNPTDGDVKVNGRIAALLELGAGFNPEFSGIDNVYMAASLYGLSREEIASRFDAIADFADIGDHINQPVKTYSSGMYVRLAFAVIAHVDADILVVDEALAVGDAVFTQKCMRFIRDFKKRGTLLFVSHDTSSVLNLCERAIWLDSGNIKSVGPAKKVVELYQQHTLEEIYGTVLADNSKTDESHDESTIEKDRAYIDYLSEYNFNNNLDRATGWKTGNGEIVSITLLNEGGAECASLKGNEKLTLRIVAESMGEFDSPIIGFLFKDRLGQSLFGENTLQASSSKKITLQPGGKIEAIFKFRLPMLPNGDYTVMASFANGDHSINTQHHWLHDALTVKVSSSKVRYGLTGIIFESIDFKVIK